VSNIIPKNVSETATNNTANSARIYDEKRRCWICNDGKYFAFNCPNKSPSDINIIQDAITEPDLPTIIDEPLLFDMRREPTLQMVSFVNVDNKGTSRCVYLSATINDRSVLCMCDADSDVNFLPYHLVDPKFIKPTTAKFYAANGTTIEILGQSRVTVQLANHVKFESEFLISERVACPLFGSKW